MEEEIIYFYNVKDGKYYQSRYTHRWLNNLQNQVQKQKEVIDKIFSRITLWKMEDITMETAKVLDDLLDILKEVSE